MLVEHVFRKMRGIIAHFRISTLGLNKLHHHQASLNMKQTSPISDCKTRVSSAHDMAVWFAENQRAVQLYDIEHPTTCAQNLDGTVYKDHQMDLNEWNIVHQSIHVLSPFAWFNNILQGTQYVTISLVLPAVNLVLMKVHEEAIVQTPTGRVFCTALVTFFSHIFTQHDKDVHTPPPPLTLVVGNKPASWLGIEVRAAKRSTHHDFKRRWVDELPDVVWEDLAVSTLLDPRFKNFDFPGASAAQRAKAFGFLRAAWVADWKPAATTPASTPRAPSSSSTSKPIDCKKQSFGAFMASVETLNAPDNVDPPPKSAIDELSQYLALPQNPDSDLDVLVWWRLHMKEFPHLAKMARQFLGAPATSAGPERLFRLAGRMHDDMKKATKEGTLQHTLMAAVNNDY